MKIEIMAKNKKKKKNRSMTAAREAVRQEIREIIINAKESKKANRREVSSVASNGIKDLKIDGARLMDMMKDLKMKESSSQPTCTQQVRSVDAISEREGAIPPVQSSARQEIKHRADSSYYDIWYDLIYSELRIAKLKE